MSPTRPSRHVAPLALGFAWLFFTACKNTPPDADVCLPPLEDNAYMLACAVSSEDYRPQSENTQWPACISDAMPDLYQPVDPDNISTTARVDAFEQMAKHLWDNPQVPSPDDFTAARTLYNAEQGLSSRVERREDVHFAALPGCERCNTTDPAPYAERCAGPVKLLPILNNAFEEGQQGTEPRIQARKIEAALLWFLYLSSLSEVQTCADSPKDCDSAWAYYTGEEPRNSPKGLAAYVHALSPETHERVYDAALAARCWRDLDRVVPAADSALQYRVLKQYDKALAHGMALILRHRASEWADPAQRAFTQTLFGLMKAEASRRNAALAEELKTLLDNPSADALDRVHSIVGALFPCP